MLILARKQGDRIVIGDNIVVTVLKIRGKDVKLGVDAPADVKIRREETDERRAA
jgi:carbon storage regulator